MKRTSFRTLVLLVELLVAVVAYQFIVWTPSATAALMWLDDDPNEVTDPNAEPQPESIGGVSWTRLDDEPTDPNAPDEQQEPLPEAAPDLPTA